jgi:CRISPR-associated endonuclease Cas1
MNSKILERIITFRSVHGENVMREIIYRKIFYQFSLVKRKDRIIFYREKLDTIKDIKDIFLIEAMSAREYWNDFENLTRDKCQWYGRKPHHEDVINKLLDVGYHYLGGIISKIFEDINLPSELGLLHRAQSKSSKPLIYDFIEWVRPLVVDQTLFILLRKKKKKVVKVSPKDIAIFINKIKKQLKRQYFNKHLGYCITLEFWIRLNALNLMSGINHNILPRWNFLSLRHESRCKNKKTPDKYMPRADSFLSLIHI